MRPFVTVIVPAHNPGRYIEPCIRSLLRQSLSRDRFEVVFIDDGSTDGTGERLNRLAREQPHVRVIHIPASGAPGRPRNVGLEAALGEYVQFLDADDELAPRALQRLIRMAGANRSDIVLGKFASETMTRRQDLFTRNRGATTLRAMPQLLDGSLGPTKLFRTALLRDREIAFPEGWRQMEDQLFTVRAYLAARVISILGDEPCYFFNKREDEGHISAELVDPALHAAHLAEILDELDRGPADEAIRRRLATRLYRTEVLARLGDSQFIGASTEYQAALFKALRTIARDRFEAGIDDGLGAIARVRSQLLLEGRFDATVLLAHRTGAFGVDTRVTRAAWTNGRLGIEFGAILARGADAHPLTVIERDGAILLDPAIADDLVGPVDVTDELRAIRAQISVVDRDTALEWILPGGAGLTLRPAGDPDDEVRIPTLHGLVGLDPQRVGPGEAPLDDGSWDVLVRWSGLGSQSAGVLRFPRRQRRPDRPPIPPALVGQPVRWVVPRSDAAGAMRLAIGGADRLPARIDDAGRRLIRDGASIAIGLPIATDRSGPIAGGVLRLTGTAGTFDLPASYDGSLGSLVVSAAAGDGDLPPRGRYEATAHLGSETAPGLPVAVVVVGEDGRLTVLGVRRLSSATRLRAWGSWTRRSLSEGIRTRALAAFRGLPPGTKDTIRSTYARLRG
jgi:poly(ribitol-phosphate) beta-N-acetylglucosaminyltransferase